MFLHNSIYITTGWGHTCCTAQLGLSRRRRAGHHRSYCSELHGLHSWAQQHQVLEQSTWHHSARAKIIQWRNMLSASISKSSAQWPGLANCMKWQTILSSCYSWAIEPKKAAADQWWIASHPASIPSCSIKSEVNSTKMLKGRTGKASGKGNFPPTTSLPKDEAPTFSSLSKRRGFATGLPSSVRQNALLF